CVSAQTNALTSAERQFRAWLDAFNDTSRAVFPKFLETEYPGHDKTEDPVHFRDLTGGLDFRKSLSSTPTRFSGLVQERDSDQFLRFDLEVESAEPHHITRLDFEQATRPAEFAIPRLPESEFITALRAQLDKDAATTNFSGAVLVVRNGKTIFARAYGLADR